jgi:Uma2 family endonuclease
MIFKERSPLARCLTVNSFTSTLAKLKNNPYFCKGSLMTSATDPSTALTPFPDHTQLPESDGTFVFAQRAVGKNFQEHSQSILLTDSIKPILQKRHPDGQYCIGQDSGIYWRITDPPEKGAEAPDWFYVGNL